LAASVLDSEAKREERASSAPIGDRCLSLQGCHQSANASSCQAQAVHRSDSRCGFSWINTPASWVIRARSALHGAESPSEIPQCVLSALEIPGHAHCPEHADGVGESFLGQLTRAPGLE